MASFLAPSWRVVLWEGAPCILYSSHEASECEPDSRLECECLLTRKFTQTIVTFDIMMTEIYLESKEAQRKRILVNPDFTNLSREIAPNYRDV